MDKYTTKSRYLSSTSKATTPTPAIKPSTKVLNTVPSTQVPLKTTPAKPGKLGSECPGNITKEVDSLHDAAKVTWTMTLGGIMVPITTEFAVGQKRIEFPMMDGDVCVMIVTVKGEWLANIDILLFQPPMGHQLPPMGLYLAFNHCWPFILLFIALFAFNTLPLGLLLPYLLATLLSSFSQCTRLTFPVDHAISVFHLWSYRKHIQRQEFPVVINPDVVCFCHSDCYPEHPKLISNCSTRWFVSTQSQKINISYDYLWFCDFGRDISHEWFYEILNGVREAQFCLVNYSGDCN